jgi:hypothetical protein
LHELDEDAPRRRRVKEDAGATVRRRLDRTHSFEARSREPRQQRVERLVHAERNMVEPRPALLEKPLEWASRARGRDELERCARPEPADGDAARHHRRRRLPAEELGERRDRRLGGDTDVVERDRREEPLGHVTVEGRW